MGVMKITKTSKEEFENSKTRERTCQDNYVKSLFGRHKNSRNKFNTIKRTLKQSAIIPINGDKCW